MPKKTLSILLNAQPSLCQKMRIHRVLTNVISKNKLVHVKLKILRTHTVTKGLLLRRHAAILLGGEAWRGSQAENEALEAVHARVKGEFPLDEAGVKRLFEGMQGHLMGLYAAETAALEGLREAVG